jgi:hypothetical protein
VPFEFNDVTIENIKTACLKHFAVEPSMTCDVLAGEQGPSCHSFKQVPDSKVIHVRFIQQPNIELETVDEYTDSTDPKPPPAKKKCSTVQSATIVEQKSK